MPDDPDHYGRLVDTDGRRAVRFRRRYRYARAEVWSAITEPDRMARWAFACEFEPRTGGALRFDYGEAGSAEGTILQWDPPAVLEYEWGADTDMAWHVRFELTPDGDDATILTFDHLLPDAANPEFAAGWHWHLDRLEEHLAGAIPAEVESDAHFEELLAHYQAS